jgi:uncharacterized protein (TIGR02594 family)
MIKTLIGLATALFLVSTVPAFAHDDIFSRALTYVGLHERQHKAQVQSVTKVNPSRVPWCAAFVNGILRQTGRQGTGSNASISFAKYKSPTRTPKKGDIVVMRGHVGFFHGFVGNGRVAVLGGNQSNRVKVSTFSTRRVLSYRSV